MWLALHGERRSDVFLHLSSLLGDHHRSLDCHSCPETRCTSIGEESKTWLANIRVVPMPRFLSTITWRQRAVVMPSLSLVPVRGHHTIAIFTLINLPVQLTLFVFSGYIYSANVTISPQMVSLSPHRGCRNQEIVICSGG
ncbi:hypothetical protein BR93DRAFT_206368 [Coniochaeta sp. PMI_546]|nr:hypothetical protein BR93DRAFT_206368 [Coniochaeta sp. PMI_546]